MAQAPRALNGPDVVTALTSSGTVLPASVIPAGSGGAGPAGATAPATTTTLGGVKVGPGLLVAGDGTLSVDTVAPVALSGAPQPADGIVLVRNGVTYLVPFSAFGSGGTAPAAATAYTTALPAASGYAGSGVTLTATPTGAAWPFGVVLTASASGLQGTFTSMTASPTGTTPAVFTFTPGAAGSGTLSVSASPAMVNSSGTVAYRAVAAGAKIGPDLTMASATYAASPNGQALSGGSGTAVLTMASGSRTIKARMFVPTTAHSFTLLALSNSTVNMSDGRLAGSFIGNQLAPAMASGWHDIRIEQDTVTNAPYGQTRVYADGTQIYTYSNASQTTANPTLTVTPSAGVLVDELVIQTGVKSDALPAAGYPAGTAGLVGDWAFDGSGASR